MSITFDHMLYVYGCIVQGKNIDLKDDIDIEAVLKMANSQGCFHSIAEFVNKSDQFYLSEETKNSLFAKLENDIIFNYLRYTAFLKLMGEFENENISCILLKGYAVAQLYHSPLSRISSDIDIKINKNDEKKAMAILKKNNYTAVNGHTEFTHHTELRHPRWGLLELHIKLFEDDVTDIWFAGNSESLRIDETPFLNNSKEGSFYSLTPESQVIHLYFHLLKHFIEGGLSIRAMMDFLMAITFYRSQINIENIIKVIRQSGMGKIYDAIICFMVKYCAFDEDMMPVHNHVGEELVQYIYDDLESGGWLGKEKENNRMAMLLFAEEKGQTLLTPQKSTIYSTSPKDKLRLIFPAAKMLARKYPYVNKSILLYPVAFITRLFKFLLKKRRVENTVSEYDSFRKENDENRIELFEEFGLLNKKSDK